MRGNAFLIALIAVAVAPAGASAQTRLYYEQTYLPASHNWVFARTYTGIDRLFNAFDYGHSILYETLWRNPGTRGEVLDVREFNFITRKLLTDPPRVPLDESAIGPDWTRLAPEAHAMFDWAHMLHRQLYDVLADERLDAREQDARVSELIRYYKSRPALAFSSTPKDMHLMEGQPYSLAFRKRFPRYNGLIWSYHWMQMAMYDALLAASDRTGRKANVDAVASRFWEMLRGPAAGLPTVMPMSAAIAPEFTEKYPEASIIFDNLHSLHDVVSDILANPNVPRSRKRATILDAAAKYRDSSSNVTTVEEWKSMSAEMSLAQMGGAAPIGRRLTPRDSTQSHKH